MTRWLIPIPVWGDPYARVFAERAVPALRAALEDFDHPVQFIVHTDRPAAVLELLDGFDAEVVEIPPDTPYRGLQDAHADGIRRARPGDRVALLTADLVVSRNFFATCDAHMERGSKLILMAGTRTDADYSPAPAGLGPRDLLSWAWDHRHPIIRDVEWGTGASCVPTVLYFARGDQVVMHGFHLSVAAMEKKDAELRLESTVDDVLADHFELGEVHVVTSPDDLAVLEVSAHERRFRLSHRPMDEIHVAHMMETLASERHKWMFRHRIVIRGGVPDDEWEMPIVERILYLMRRRAP
jgi:hypothetical protein